MSWAAQAGHEDLVHYLADHGAKIESLNRYGFAPLQLAVQGNHGPVVALLIELGADINRQGNSGATCDNYN